MINVFHNQWHPFSPTKYGSSFFSTKPSFACNVFYGQRSIHMFTRKIGANCDAFWPHAFVMRTGICCSPIVGLDESGTKNLGLGFICSTTSQAIYRKLWKNAEREDQKASWPNNHHWTSAFMFIWWWLWCNPCCADFLRFANTCNHLLCFAFHCLSFSKDLCTIEHDQTQRNWNSWAPLPWILVACVKKNL